MGNAWASRFNRRYALVSVLTAWLVGAGLLALPLWQAAEERVFDLLSLVTAPGKTQLPITIIGIDDASFTQLGQRWPWPRDMHAKLIERLTSQGAAVIAFDVMFPEPAGPAEDGAFAKAIGAAGNVVLAADHGLHETANARLWMRIDPIPELTLAGASTGLASVELGGDGVARRFSQHPDAFWRETVRTLMRTRPGMVAEPYMPPDAMIRHLGIAHTFPYFSYYQVLNGDPNIPAQFFADQIVLVGRDVRSSPEAGTSQDAYATPFLLTSKLLTPGVEIQATMIENALMGQAIMPARARMNLLALGVVLLIAWPVLLFWHPLRSGFLITAIAVATVGASAMAFAQHLWFATAAPVLALVIAGGVMSSASFFAERRRTQQIRGAFSLYVSRTVVDQMLAQPERLKLGGERRELTLLFGDLAGFTSLAERLPPDALAAVINLYLNEMTRIIMGSGGTVDKFIGDAVMAFWGAPLEDSAHALRGATAAIDMQAAMERLQPEFARLGAQKLGLRIGLHSGPAVVGNMGSDLRFDYTALGDTVNLASRLEGVNKSYGTRILLSADTRSKLNGAIGLRRVDRVRVKGKETPIDIFTPCEDAVLCAATEEAWEAYAAKDWQRAQELWERIRQSTPGDSLAAVFLTRLAEYRVEMPAEPWEACVALEKL